MRRQTIHQLRRNSGTSLIELLVVIVVFLIGILAIAQIFPGGFKILSTTRAASVATALGRSEMDRIRKFSDELPEEVLSVINQSDGTVVALTNRSDDDLGPQGPGVDKNGNILDGAGNSLGKWQFASGANAVRRIIGESKTIPSPAQLGTVYGGLVTLQFAPISYSTTATNLIVYGNDLEKLSGPPPTPLTGQQLPLYQIYVDNSDQAHPKLYIPEDPASAHNYKLSLTAYYNTGTVDTTTHQPILDQKDFVSLAEQTVPIAPDPTTGSFFEIDLTALPAGVPAGETFNSIDFESVRLAVRFDMLTLGSTFSATNPYQFQLLDPALGSVLVNPSAYQFTVGSQSGELVPLRLRADYDVYDWRILKEDFRIPDTEPFNYSLHLSNLKHHNGVEPDGSNFPGLNVMVQSGSGTLVNPDVIVMDLQTGGIYTPGSYSVDYHRGLISFTGNSTSGLQASIIYPGNTVSTTINAAGRSVRIMYQAVGEWSTQLLRAASQYLLGLNANPPPGQYYVAPRTSTAVSTNSDTTIRFPIADLNKTVTIDSVYYLAQVYDPKNPMAPQPIFQVLEAKGHTFAIKKDNTPGGAPFADLNDLAPPAFDPGTTTLDPKYGTPNDEGTVTLKVIGADFSNGYSVRGVKGTSVSVRVLYNTDPLKLTTDNNQNITNFEQFERGYHRVTTESTMERGLLQ
jgi:type II secretory pathway pseudopilin PulG